MSTDREQATRAAKGVAMRIVLLAVLAVVVVGLQSVLGNLGTVLVTFFLALTAVFLVRCGYALLSGLIALVSTPFARREGAPKAGWLLAGVLLNALEAAVCLGLALYVLRAAGWWTEIQVPIVDEFGQPYL